MFPAPSMFVISDNQHRVCRKNGLGANASIGNDIPAMKRKRNGLVKFMVQLAATLITFNAIYAGMMGMCVPDVACCVSGSLIGFCFLGFWLIAMSSIAYIYCLCSGQGFLTGA